MLILLRCLEKSLLLTLIGICLSFTLLPSGPRGSPRPNRAGQSLPPLLAALWTIFAHLMTLFMPLLSTRLTWVALFLGAPLSLISVLSSTIVTLSLWTLLRIH